MDTLFTERGEARFQRRAVEAARVACEEWTKEVDIAGAAVLPSGLVASKELEEIERLAENVVKAVSKGGLEKAMIGVVFKRYTAFIDSKVGRHCLHARGRLVVSKRDEILVAIQSGRALDRIENRCLTHLGQACQDFLRLDSKDTILYSSLLDRLKEINAKSYYPSGFKGVPAYELDKVLAISPEGQKLVQSVDTIRAIDAEANEGGWEDGYVSVGACKAIMKVSREYRLVFNRSVLM